MPRPADPSWRRGAGIAAIVGLIIFWSAAILVFAPYIGRWPVVVQALFYLFIGIVWIIPLKPLLVWSETGSWRKPRSSDRTGQAD